MLLQAPTPLSSFSWAILLLMLVSVSFGQSPECKRDSGDKKEPPTFICFVEVTVSRNENCSARITEKFLFPHTNGEIEWRPIPAVDGEQEVFNIELFRSDKEKKLTRQEVFTATAKNEVRVRLKTEKLEIPVRFELSYTLSNAVTKFTQSCKSKTEPDENKNVLRWRSGESKHSFDELSVTFETNNADAKLAVLGDHNAASGASDQKVTVQKKDVRDNVDIYVSESGVKLCSAELACFRSGFNEVPLIIALGIVGLVALIALVWCVLRYSATTRKLAAENAEEDIEEP